MRRTFKYRAYPTPTQAEALRHGHGLHFDRAIEDVAAALDGDDRAEPAEAPEGGTDEADQIAPAAEIETPPEPEAEETTVAAEKPKRKAPAKRRSTKKSSEDKSRADDASS